MLSKKEAQKILDSVEFPASQTGSEDTSLRDSKLAAAPKSLRRTLIQQSGGSSEKRSAAAIEVQRIWRGYWARCRVFAIVNPRVSRQANPTFSQVKISQQKYDKTPSTSPVKEGHSPTRSRTGARKSNLQMYYRRYCETKEKAGETDVVSFEEFCANYIQNWWNRVKHTRLKRPPGSKSSIRSGPYTGSGKSVRIASQPMMASRQGSTAVSEPVSKQSTGLRKPRTEPPDRLEAAVIIQRAWRRHIDIQVYRYYRDLINFRNRGNPSMMLRCINPKEAQLLDAAAGVHIRFRLAGERFPPNIYYKIFTHRPIEDMCANSPKDYTRPEAKRKAAKDMHNKTGRNKSSRKIGWYERTDNNGWRLVSDRLLQRIDQDPITWESSHRKQVFHHDKLKRRQDVEKKRKQRKVQWMQKMYREGMLKARSNDKETIALIEGAAQGMVETVEAEGPEALEEWEVDELLDWTNALNFDDYLSSWKEVATSANSEQSAQDKVKIYAGKSDPYEITVTGEMTPTAPSPSRVTTLNSPTGRPTPVTPLGAIR
ncbi:uncharacterized protein [Ptychodera flava]|uniref:uncharacterized protein n=1 Tax=Ptychodera flava TaxID=63121 RepID=UPI00396AAC7B